MTTPRVLLAAVVLLCPFAVPASSQSFVPKTIQFKGDPGHSDEELLAAAGLKKGMVLTAAEMNAHTKQLMDSGAYEDITFTYNGQDLVLQLIPTNALYDIRLENFPLPTGKDFEDRLHARFPLYHGKVPFQGTLTDGVSQELQDELAAKGILHATVTALPFTDTRLGKVTAISYTITKPDIKVGDIQWGLTPAITASKARDFATKTTGSPYYTDGSKAAIEVNIGNLYREQGYLEAKINATPQPKFLIDGDGVHIPFSVSIEQGPQYKLTSVDLAPDIPMTQADFYKFNDLHNGEIVSAEKLRGGWEYLARQYHNKGYMQAKIEATPNYDRAQSTVSYAVTVTSGPVYTMGTLRVLKVNDDIREMLLKAWKIPSGTVFNEGAIRSLTATNNVNIALENALKSMILSYTLKLHDDVHTVDVDLTLQKKP